MAFDRPSLRELISQMQADAEREAGATQLRQSNLRVLPKVSPYMMSVLITLALTSPSFPSRMACCRAVSSIEKNLLSWKV